jgi:catechol 2,3-dioxygenase-like lactoylglutathione lyase family enzyme
MTTTPVRQLRLVVQTPDFDEALAFFRDVLGTPTELTGESDPDDRWVILDLGRATIELANSRHVDAVDELETGSTGGSGQFRLALEVADVRGTAERVVAADQQLLGGPSQMPWGSVNARVTGPSGLQITLFQEP